MFLLQIPNEFFTPESMLTLTSSSMAVFIISNGMQTAFNFNPKWLALILSLIISIAGVYFSNGKSVNYFVGVINGFLIYATVAGGTQIVGRPNPDRNDPDITASGLEDTKRKFLSRWY